MRLSYAFNRLSEELREETIQMSATVSGALILLAFVIFSGPALAADIINKPLAACPAEKKAIGDVNSCGKKWKVRSGQAQVLADGMINVQVSGLVLDDTSVGDANGTPDGVDAVAVAILCDGKVAAQTDPVALSKQGDAKVTGTISVPQGCASPVVVVRERYEGKIGGWLASTGQ
jgi:hypothetical protein